ncbi:MAG: DUF58 domain-containing protein [Proteobacteria bacterium]|nr:DUF58 domain-containing protein [Pseudomonadota bacterium]
MLSSELIAEIKHLELKSRRMATDALSGAYSSMFHGRGMEFQEVREYVPGDDVRAIDWNVTARTNVPHIKVYREERELTILVVVDLSASMQGIPGIRAPIDAARELAAVIAWLGIRNNDRVGLLLFSDRVEHYLPPKKGRGHVWRIIKDLFAVKGLGRSTNISAALNHIQLTLRRRASVFMLSDFWDDTYRDPLKRCALQHDLTCVTFRDEATSVLPNAGLVRWRDRETGQEILINTSDPNVRGAFALSERARAERFRSLFLDSGADYFDVLTIGSVVKPLATYLQTQGRRRRSKPGAAGPASESGEVRSSIMGVPYP